VECQLQSCLLTPLPLSDRQAALYSPEDVTILLGLLDCSADVVPLLLCLQLLVVREVVRPAVERPPGADHDGHTAVRLLECCSSATTEQLVQRPWPWLRRRWDSR